MDIKLSNQEILYLYGLLKKELSEMESLKQKSLVKADVQFLKQIIASLECTMPQLKSLPI